MSLFAILVVTRWVHFAALFALFGVSLFWFYAGRERLPTGAMSLPWTLRVTERLQRILMPVAALSGIAWLAETLANITGTFASVVDPATLHLFFFSTQFGPVSILRLMLFAAGVGVAVMRMRRCIRFAGLLAIAGLLLVSQAWLGHAAEGGAGIKGAAMIGLYSLHMLAAAAWVGGLPALALALAEISRGRRDQAPARMLALLSRYSLMAMVAVSLIVISGIETASFRVGLDFGRLYESAYGMVLLAKLFIVALMLALAYFNRFVVMPRLRLAAAEATAPTGGLFMSVVAELVLGVLVLGFAAILGITPPLQ